MHVYEGVRQNACHHKLLTASNGQIILFSLRWDIIRCFIFVVSTNLYVNPPCPITVPGSTRHKNQTDVVRTEGHLLNLLDCPPLLSPPVVCIGIEEDEKKRKKSCPHKCHGV